jgi:hypothetical protein
MIKSRDTQDRRHVHCRSDQWIFVATDVHGICLSSSRDVLNSFEGDPRSGGEHGKVAKPL